MFWYSVASWMLGWSYNGLPYMMCGLFTACMYVIFDTQIIIEQAEAGDKDVPTHTMTLFINLFDLFIKIVQVLMELNKVVSERPGYNYWGERTKL
jgi:FtsH-binding integral membrane protein